MAWLHYAQSADPNFSAVRLLLHGTSPLVDSSPLANALTITGATISSAQSKFNGTSIAFDGNDDYIDTAPGATFDLGTITTSTQFTAEAWVYLNTVSTSAFRMLFAHALPGSGDAGGGRGGWSIRESGGRLYANLSQNIPNTIVGWYATRQTKTAVLTANEWTHVAFVLVNGEPKFFVNGVEKEAEWASGSNFGTTFIGMDTTRTDYGLRVGSNLTDAYNQYPVNDFDGYMDEVRLTFGVARYTADFTPPTAPFGNY